MKNQNYISNPVISKEIGEALKELIFNDKTYVEKMKELDKNQEKLSQNLTEEDEKEIEKINKEAQETAEKIKQENTPEPAKEELMVLETAHCDRCGLRFKIDDLMYVTDTWGHYICNWCTLRYQY